MNPFKDKVLVIAQEETKQCIVESLNSFSNLEIIEADNEKKAFELIYTHSFVLVLADQDFPHLDLYNIGAMLMSHRSTCNIPLLIITTAIAPGKFLTDFKALHIDYLLKPFDKEMLQAKIKIFHELHKQKNAVAQSLSELDNIYKKIAHQNESAIHEDYSKKEMAGRLFSTVNQIRQPLKTLQAGANRLLQQNSLTPGLKTGLTAIKTAGDRIAVITRKLTAPPVRAGRHIRITTETKNIPDHGYEILFVEDSNEDFNIFKHFIRGVVLCTVYQAKTIEAAVKLISEKKIHMIFINYRLPDGTGFDLLSKLNQLRADIPMIFTLEKADLRIGPEALAKGASSYFVKEEISSESIFFSITNTLKKAKISREAEDTLSRITMISRKDLLTRLYNRQCFEEALESAISNARRYHTPLSVLLIDFDRFKETVNKIHGYDTGDAILSTSAALIQSMVRNNDMVCRYGGEEFGIVLPNTAIGGARILAERIREKISGFGFEAGSTLLRMTVSIGIAAYDHASVTEMTDLIKNSLKALTSAMEKGGGRIQTYIP